MSKIDGIRSNTKEYVGIIKRGFAEKKLSNVERENYYYNLT